MTAWSRQMSFISITCGSRLQHAVYRLPIRQKGFSFWAKLELTDKEIEVVLNGGQLRTLKKNSWKAEKEA